MVGTPGLEQQPRQPFEKRRALCPHWAGWILDAARHALLPAHCCVVYGLLSWSVLAVLPVSKLVQERLGPRSQRLRDLAQPVHWGSMHSKRLGHIHS